MFIFLRVSGYSNPFNIRALNETGNLLGTKTDDDGREYLELATDIRRSDRGKIFFKSFFLQKKLLSATKTNTNFKIFCEEKVYVQLLNAVAGLLMY